MKKKFLIILLALVFVFSNLAQAGRIEVNLNMEVEPDVTSEGTEIDEPVIEDLEDLEAYIYEVQKEVASGFKLNGGPLLAYMKLDLEEFNSRLPEGFAGLPEDILFSGGGGLIGSRNGSRIGGYGYEGETSAIGSDGKKIRLKMSYGGFLYEKGIYSTEKADLALGAVFGAGKANLDLIYGHYQDWNEPRSNSFQRDFVFVMPGLDFHYQLAAFLGLDLSLAYLLDFSGADWKFYNKKVDLALDNFSSPQASLRLSFGF